MLTIIGLLPMENFAEAFAHFCHGMASLFFLMRAVRLFPLRRRNGRFMMLFLSTACMAFIELKDIIYMADEEWLSAYAAWISVLVDIFMVPVMALFFMESLSPGRISRKRVLLMFAPNVSFLIAYIVTGNADVPCAALAYAAVSGILLFTAVFLAGSGRPFLARYGFQGIGEPAAEYARRSMAALAFMPAVWASMIWLDSRLADVAFYAVTIAVWEYVYRLTVRSWSVHVTGLSESGQDCFLPVSEDNVSAGFVPALVSCMEDGKLYLNPRLTLYDVASAAGTNRTYLSAYLNGELNTTFYDYVNGYRVREACRLIDSGTKKTLAEISELSGFNSLSTFNRAFSRHAGMSPSEYMKSSASRSC